ncbi:MAG TPA: GAF domain-containing protein, partial [Pseudonocardia sp.]|uniref:GAF domain-containing protein n=1 Tax=Pseudonocardia sp. TaxID=60912 RepID=UPI002CF325D0
MHSVPREPAATRLRLPARGAGLSPRHRLAGALTGLVVLPLLTLGLAQLREVVTLPSQTLLYLLAVVVVALVGGLVPALVAAVAAAVLLDHYFIPPLDDFAVADPDNVVALVAFVLVAGAASSGLTARRREAEALVTARAEGREELCRLAEEQAALRRVATLVARAVSSEEVFAAVTAEVGRLLGADLASMLRYDPDGAATWLGAWRATGAAFPISVGARVELRGRNAATLVFETGRPARIDDYSGASGPVADVVYAWGVRAAVGAPISVEGRAWGVMVVSSSRAEPLPADTEARLAGFAELVATAIANAEGRAQLEESRDELRRLADEQAALRRVATLVAHGLPPGEVLAAVAHEVGSVLGADGTNILRLDPDGATTVVARVGAYPAEFPIGSRWTPQPPLALAAVLHTGHSARIDDFSQASDAYADAVGRLGLRSGVAAPIVVEGRLWGAIAVGTRRERFPADTEQRMAGFTELVGTAIANAEGRAQLEESRDELRRLAEEQAALRRVATLVAHGVPAAEVLAAVAQEVGQILGADSTLIARLDADDATTLVAGVGEHPAEYPIGSRWNPEPPVAMAAVLRTGRPARNDDYSQASSASGDAIRRLGIRSSVAVPIVVEGRLWGAIGVGTRRERFPADAEQRMAGFTELVGTAIANAEGRAQLEESRDGLRRLADEQAALRRVATLVAHSVRPDEIFAA